MRLGDWGENTATLYLEKKGYKILERNYRCKFGEVDIIAENAGTIVFFEVKTRKSLKYGLPCESITENKKLHFHKTVDSFFSHGRNGVHFKDYKKQIDVIEILIKDGKGYIHQIENAF